MLIPSDSVTSPLEEPMQCMEVWGGSGPANNHFIRPGLDIWVWSRPGGEPAAGGGDLRLLSSCASGRITRMLLADVCGYDSMLMELATELRDLVKRNVNSIAQARLVRQMSCRLDAVSQQGCFASTLVSTYFAPTRTFTLCNAGHPPPLLYRAQAREWSILKRQPKAFTSAGNALGVLDPREYQEFKTKLEVGDMLLSYSNSVTECRDSEGRTIGLQGLLERVRRLEPDAGLGVLGRFIAQIQNERAGNLASDDATMLLCKATETPVPWRDNVLAPLRLFRSVSDRTKIG